MDARGSMVSRKHRLNSTTKTKRDPEARSNDLGIFERVLSRSKLRREYRKYEGLYRKGKARTDQVMPALTQGTCHRGTRKNLMER